MPLSTTLTVAPDFTVLTAGLNRTSSLTNRPALNTVPPTIRISFFFALAAGASASAGRPMAAVAATAIVRRRFICGILP